MDCACTSCRIVGFWLRPLSFRSQPGAMEHIGGSAGTTSSLLSSHRFGVPLLRSGCNAIPGSTFRACLPHCPPFCTPTNSGATSHARNAHGPWAAPPTPEALPASPNTRKKLILSSWRVAVAMLRVARPSRPSSHTWASTERLRHPFIGGATRSGINDNALGISATAANITLGTRVVGGSPSRHARRGPRPNPTTRS